MSRAAERTALAWQRTALTATATAAVFVSHAFISGRTDLAWKSIAAAAILLVNVALAVARTRSLNRGRWRGNHTVVSVTAVVALSCLLAASSTVW